MKKTVSILLILITGLIELKTQIVPYAEESGNNCRSNASLIKRI